MNRQQRRAAVSVARKADRVGEWGRWEERPAAVASPLAPPGLSRAFLNAVYSVQVFGELDTPLGPAVPVGVRRHDGAAVRRWHDLQRIKSELFGADRVAVEVYPAEADLSDAANMYWLWVLPAGVRFPFRLA